MKRDRLEFIDALRQLGESVGLEMPRSGAKQKPGERQLLYDMQSAAASYFARLFEHPQHGQAARGYVAQRGFNADSIRAFQIGFSVDKWDGLMLGPVGKKFPPEQLQIGGLVKPRENGGGFYDTFRNRLMFPIHDDSGRVIAFGGRQMPGSDVPPKYLNSPETPVFSKSKTLFGLNRAKEKIVETGTVVVVEGYTDVVMAHQFGASNVVSPLGTSLTEPHVNILRRFAKRIVLLFDPDAAGDREVDRAVGLFLTQEIDIAVANIPGEADPDEYLLAHGVEAFNQVIATATDALTFKWKMLLRKFNATGDSLTGQQKTVEEYLGVLASARGSGPVDAIRWGRALAQVSRLTEIPVDQLNRRFKKSRTQVQEKRPPPTDPAETHAGTGEQPTTVDPVLPVRRQLSARELAERRLLGVLLIEPARWPDVQKDVSLQDFADDLHHRLAEMYWRHQRDEGEPVFNEFLGLLEEDNLRELAVVAVEEAEALANLDALVTEAINFFGHSRRRAEERKLLTEVQRTSVAGDDDLLKKIQEQARTVDLRRI